MNAHIALADLVLRLGAIQRATFHQDGVTPESDATHTVMLALWASVLAPASGLDGGLAAQFALVHDLVEAHAGDTNTTMPLVDAAAVEKADREHAAYLRIKSDLDAFPWVAAMIERYDAQEEPEARFVRYLDKITPKLTHKLNSYAAIKAQGISREALIERHANQGRSLASMYPEFAEIAALFDVLCRVDTVWGSD